MGAQFGDGFAVLGDDDGLSRARDLVHQREALGFEFRCLNSRHGDAFTKLTTIMTMVTIMVNVGF